MPITTLTNISVPTAGPGSNSGLLMPKLQYRFRVFLDSFGVATAGDEARELTRQVADVTRPNVTFDQIQLDVYNSKTYLAGKHTWEPITLTLREDVNNSMQKIVGQQLQKQFDFFEQSSAVSGGTYKFQTRIEILDGGNGGTAGAGVIDRFHLVGCYLESVNYNTLAYNSNDPVTITLSIRYDNAIQFGLDGREISGIGAPVPFATINSPGGTQATGG
jgi:hypothetical protein